MPFRVAGHTVSHVAVIGSGQIGPDIALYFAKLLAPLQGRVTVVDLYDKALQAGRARCQKKIEKGSETGAWKPAQGEAMRAALTFTTDYAAIADAELVLEAATEDEALKGRIFAQVESLVGPRAILLSNSSHLEPERIFANVQRKARTAVAHWFFPAERNPMVEIVPGADTDPGLTTWLLRFFEAAGKVPVQVASRYGYAADPVFEGVFQAACLAVAEGLGTVKEVDWAAKAALGMTVGPFTAMNLTGGNPITQHGLDFMHERLGPWFQAPPLLNDWLRDQAPGAPWPVAQRGEVVDVPPEREHAIADALRGAYLGIAFGILDAGIVTPADMELLIELALDMTPPCKLVQQLGRKNALAHVTRYCKTNPLMPVPRSLHERATSEVAHGVSRLLIHDEPAGGDGVVRVMRIRRPKVLNALDHAMYGELAEALQSVETDPRVVGGVLAGFGTKAFVSGADVRALATIQSPDDGYAIAKLGQDVARVIEKMRKPVVAALNGIAFGGGLELAMACRARVAVAGQRALCGQPEVNLGIIPAAGGTQRLPRLIGVAAANRLLRTGAPIGSDEALSLGLVHALHEPDDLLRAAGELVVAIARGEAILPRMPEAPIAAGEPDLEPVDIGHRSQKVDALLSEAIRYGAAHSLDEGLKRELDVFRRICALQDMRIGVDHFVKSGPKTPAPFVHA
jgi:enoyl-CoA hydratase/3-hydroxyacyl-CoA dehydrogenase